MPTLSISSFSCIEAAKIELADLTLLIGPQASGKSIISKLMYFFNDIIESMYFSLDDEIDLEGFTINITEKFKKWFPPGTWGNGKFAISYEAGPYKVFVRRPSVSKSRATRIEVLFSEFFTNHYENMLKLVSEKISRSRSRSEDITTNRYEVIWRVRRHSENIFDEALGKENIRHQFFIPAGRSFFTSMGKAVVAFEQGGILDPVTVQFGRLFTSLRDENAWGWRRSRKSREEIGASDAAKNLFGGRIRFSREQDYLEMEDGRIIPFSLLSSGQQELLPLWVVLDYISHEDLISKNMVFIEEPEAHLFPCAQGLLTEYISSIASKKNAARRILITTHSPYLLAKTNNLIKAGAIAQALGKSVHDKLSAILPRESWLKPNSTRAYAIIDGELTSIMDEDGLIDAAFLDGVSGDISREFSELLEIEFDHG